MFGISFHRPFEALLRGTPVVVTDGCGHLVHYGDVAGLSNALRSSLEHPNANRKMVEARGDLLRRILGEREF